MKTLDVGIYSAGGGSRTLIQSGQILKRDDRLFDVEQAREHPTVFTTFLARVNRDPKQTPQKEDTQVWSKSVIGLSLHLNRIIENARILGVDRTVLQALTQEQIRKYLSVELEHFLSHTEVSATKTKIRVRLLMSNHGLEIFLDEYQNNWEDLCGVSAVAASVTRPTPALKTVPSHESCNARKAAISLGVDEAILVDSEGIVREGAWTNIFWVDDRGRLFTTKHKVLPGIMRALIVGHFAVNLEDWTLTQIKQSAREIFLTQSTSGITPVLQFDGWRSGQESHQTNLDSVTEKIRSWYNGLIGELI